MNERTASLLILVGATLVIVFASAILFCSAFFVFNITVSWFDIPLAAGLAGAFAWVGAGLYFPQRRRRIFVQVIGICIAAFTVCTLVEGFIYDTSWDGQTYQTEGALQLARGWNPFRESPPANTIYPTYLSFFAKGPWLWASALYKLTGNFEQGKAFQMLLMLACWLLAMAALATFRRLSRRWILIFSLLIALNPVSSYQLYSFYVDGLLSSCLCMIVCVLILIYRQPDRLKFALLAALLILTINIKLNGAIYAGLLAGGFGLYYAIVRKASRTELLTWIVVGGVVGGVFVGYNPYITQYVGQLIAHHDPLYPTDWKTLTAIDNSTPKNFLGMTAWEKLCASLFSKSQPYDAPTVLKIPFAVSMDEIDAFRGVDAHIGGFGTLYGGVLLLTMVMLILAVWKCRRRLSWNSSLWVIVGLILISGVSNPEAWWARYVPQLWLVPVLATLSIMITVRPSWLRSLNIIAVAALCLNCVLIIVPNTSSALRLTIDTSRQLAELKHESDREGVLPAAFTGFVATRYRFDQWGIRYRVEGKFDLHNIWGDVSDLPCPPEKQQRVVSSQARFCTST